MLTDDNGSIEETYRYSAYGTVLDGNTAITPYLYNGQYGVSTGADGLNYMRARYYDSVSGRFINRDTVSGTIEDSRSLNRYAYCYGNPVSYADPFGLSPLVSMRNHAVLDVLGMIPGGIGIAADLMNALYYIAEGDVKQAIESVVMSAFSVAPADLVKNVIGICIGVYGIYGGLQQVGEDVDRYFANWDSYSEEERLLEAQILACHVLGLGGSIAGTVSAAEGYQKTDSETDYNKKTQEVQKKLTDPTGQKYDSATEKRVNGLVSGGKVSENGSSSGNGGRRTDFYVTPSEDIVPAIGYRYVSENASYLNDMTNNMTIPANADGTYFSFNNYDTANPSALQVPHDASVKVSFDTLQIIDDISIPYGNWGKASYLEPITIDFPQFGSGGATQVITHSQIKIKSITKLPKH